MNVAYDKAVFQSLHGIGKDIPADCLHDVFHELRPVTLDSAPFLGGIYAHIGNTFAAELVHADAGFDVCQFSAGWQGDEQHAAFYREGDVSDLF